MSIPKNNFKEDNIEYEFLNRKEFETFLLIYASHVDYVFSDEEKKHIKAKTSEEIYTKMYDLFNNNPDYTSMKILLKNKEKYLSQEKDKLHFFDSLKDLFKIDGDYSRIEKSFLHFFQRIIEE